MEKMMETTPEKEEKKRWNQLAFLLAEISPRDGLRMNKAGGIAQGLRRSFAQCVAVQRRNRVNGPICCAPRSGHCESGSEGSCGAA